MSGGSEVTNAMERGMGKSTLLVDTGHDGDTDYADATGIDISSNADYTPKPAIHAILLTDNAGAEATGNLDVTLLGGGRMIIPCIVAAGDHLIVLRGVCIATIHGDTTSTFDGVIYPLW